MIEVAHGEFSRIHALPKGFRQRLGGDDESTSRKDEAGQALLLKVMVGVARDQHLVREHCAALRFHPYLRALDNPRDLAVFENRRAKPFGGARLSKAEVERMQMTVDHAQHAAEIGVRAKHLNRLISLHQAKMLALTGLAVMFNVLCQTVKLAVLERDFDEAILQVAFDRVLFHARFDDFVASIMKLLNFLRAKMLGEVVAAAEAADELAAVSPGRAPADAILFKKRNGMAALGERQRAGHAGEPASDDAYLRLVLACKWRMSRLIVPRGGVVGARVFFVWHGVLNQSLACCLMSIGASSCDMGQYYGPKAPIGTMPTSPYLTAP